MVQREIAENPKILCSANFLDPFTTYITVSAPNLSYSLSYSQLKSGSQFLGGEILQNFWLKNWIFSALGLSKKFLLAPMDFSDIILTETEYSWNSWKMKYQIL